MSINSPPGVLDFGSLMWTKTDPFVLNRTEDHVRQPFGSKVVSDRDRSSPMRKDPKKAIRHVVHSGLHWRELFLSAYNS